MHIFLGLVEVANIASTYAKAFRAMGHSVTIMAIERNRFYPEANYDYLLRSQSKPSNSVVAALSDYYTRGVKPIPYFFQLREQFDVFIFLWGTSFFPYYLDYPLLKKAGKKIVATFWGTEIRYGPALAKEMDTLGVRSEIEPYLRYLKTVPTKYFARKRMIRQAEQYADLILSQQGFGQLQKRPYMRANVPLDLLQYSFKIPARKIPLVVHAPSKRNVKGTSYVLTAVEELKQEGIDFDFKLIENTPNPQVRALLSESDILVDELFSETIGMLSAEGMATGNAVLVRYMPEYGHIPPGCPAVITTCFTVKDRLREMILDQKLRCQLAEQGRVYVQVNNDHMQVVKSILDWLEPGGIREYDYNPTFYRQVTLSPGEWLKEAISAWHPW
jgi:hypothetical protein